MDIYTTQQNKGKKNGEAGFTLVETLVAIAIFASAITGLISITARGINDNVFVKNKLIASYLAAEGIELVRNMRDNAALDGISTGNDYWSTFLTDSTNGIGDCYSPNGTNICMIDGSPEAALMALPCGGQCPALFYDETVGAYGYLSGTSTNFVRTIQALPVAGNPDEIIVTSSVSWQQGENTHSTSYQYNLLDWIQPQ